MKSLFSDQISDDDLPLRTLLGLTRQDEAVGDLRQLQIAPLRGRGALRLLLNGGMALVAGFTMMMETAWPVVVGALALVAVGGGVFATAQLLGGTNAADTPPVSDTTPVDSTPP